MLTKDIIMQKSTIICSSCKFELFVSECRVNRFLENGDNSCHFLNKKVYYICLKSNSLLTYDKTFNPSKFSMSGYLFLI